MTDYQGLVDRVDAFYESVVTVPGDWPDARIVEWADDLAADDPGLDREARRAVRRVMRVATRLAAFWADESAARPDDHGDWRTRVDIAAGARAWRPVLDIAMHGLKRQPTADLYATAKDRFAVVTSQRWMEGIDYDEWLASHRG